MGHPGMPVAGFLDRFARRCEPMTNPFPLLHLPDLPVLRDLSRASGSWLAMLGIGLAVGLPVSSAADSADADEPARSSWAARWLDHDAEKAPQWMGENMYFKKGTGLEYRHDAKLGQNSIEVGVQGPLLKKKKDATSN